MFGKLLKILQETSLHKIPQKNDQEQDFVRDVLMVRQGEERCFRCRQLTTR